MKTVAIIGAGAAGLMSAATIKDAKVFLIEKNPFPGHKVKISGGGRCNITTGLSDINDILKNYPRGVNFLKPAMYNFPPAKVCEWFESHGVELKTEKDMRVFPVSNKGADIVHVFEKIFENGNVELILNNAVVKVEHINNKFTLSLVDGRVLEVDKLIITTGGQAYGQTGSTGDGYAFARDLGHTITPLAPSLGSYSLMENWLKDLAGVSFSKIKLKLFGRTGKYEFCGPALITHKGITGPAVFALSSLCAYENFSESEPVPLFLDFCPDMDYKELAEVFIEAAESSPDSGFLGIISGLVPRSFAKALCVELGIEPTKNTMDLSKKEINKIIEGLKNMKFNVIGRVSGEEFVTAGGVDLREVNSKTMESKICPELFFAGEILDIDGFTGGFNLQAAWATGRLAGEHVVMES